MRSAAQCVLLTGFSHDYLLIYVKGRDRERRIEIFCINRFIALVAAIFRVGPMQIQNQELYLDFLHERQGLKYLHNLLPIY